MDDLRIIAITHKNFPLDTIGKFHLSDEEKTIRLQSIKETFGIGEIMFLSTCNRIELIFTLSHFVCPGITANILQLLQPSLQNEFIKQVAQDCERFNGKEVAEHLLRVASGINSMVIGEREIITQLRKAYEENSTQGLCGDDIRILVSQCVKTAKEIFTNTDLAKKPVSVVSLAWQQFREYGIKPEARILMIGAGHVIRNFTKFLFENGYHNITIANRSIQRAEEISQSFPVKTIALDEIRQYTGGIDVLISCTASENIIVNAELYAKLITGEKNQKLIFDLAIPKDIDSTIPEKYNVRYIDMEKINLIASSNITFREKALVECEPILNKGIKEYEKSRQTRQIEKAMLTIPETIKEIRNTAVGSVFAKDLENLDENSRELIEKMMSYMEKKYISIPMKMARTFLLSEVGKN